MEDSDDDDIICHTVENNSLFTIEIYSDRSLYITQAGNLQSYIGEKDVEGYKACLEAFVDLKE